MTTTNNHEHAARRSTATTGGSRPDADDPGRRRKDGKPDGGIKKLEYKKGDRSAWSSAPTSPTRSTSTATTSRRTSPAGGSVQLQLPGEHRGRVRDRARGPQGADRRAARRAVVSGAQRRLVALGFALRRGAAGPAFADAHGLVGRADLPIPEWLFGWAAAVVLVVSFVGLATLWQKPSWRTTRLPAAPDWLSFTLVNPVTEVLAGAIGVGLLGLDHLDRLRRRADADRQLGADVHLRDLLGRAGSARASCSATSSGRSTPGGRSPGRPASSRRALPARCRPRSRIPHWLGRWPAAADDPRLRLDRAGLCERPGPQLAGARDARLLGDHPDRDRVLRHGGVDRATARASRVYYNLFSRISRGSPSATGCSGCAAAVGARAARRRAGTVALLVVMLGTVAFDGASEGPRVEQPRAAHPGLLQQPRASAPRTRSSSPSRSAWCSGSP